MKHGLLLFIVVVFGYSSGYKKIEDAVRTRCLAPELPKKAPVGSKIQGSFKTSIYGTGPTRTILYTTEYVFDVDGKYICEVAIDAGKDLTPFTEDDQITAYMTYTYDKNGRVAVRERVTNPGADKMFFTDDDVKAPY